MKFVKLAQSVAGALAIVAMSGGLAHAEECGDLGMAGLLSKKNRGEMPKFELSAGKPLTEQKTIELKSGKYYELEITADGSQELALAGNDFFRAIWIDEVVINGIEVRPLGVDSLEFDDPGTAEISFVAIKPGSFSLGVPGRKSQTVEIQIK